MKWFKHENTFNNPKIERLTEKHGSEGYGVYFRIVELIATDIEPNNSNEWGFLPKEYDDEYLAKKLGVTTEKLRSITGECFKLNLLQNKEGRIYCYQTLERADDYMQRIINKTPNKLRSNSEQTPNKVVQTPSRIEEKRIEENRKDKINNIGASPNFKKFEEAKQNLVEKLSHHSGISQAWQEKAFRYAKYLHISLDDQTLKGRWLHFFKFNQNSVVDSAVSSVKDAPTFLTIDKPEEKVKYFFSVCYGRIKPS